MATTAPKTKTLILITGANKGLGLATAKALLTSHPNTYHILLGSRSPTRGAAAVASLHALGLTSVSPLTLDVTSDASISTAFTTVAQSHGYLDILINNAGISLDHTPYSTTVSLRTLYTETFNTNVFGAAAVTDAFLPLLAKSSNPHIIFQSSDLGSLTRRVDHKDPLYGVPYPVYRASKAALDMVALCYVKELGDRGGEEGREGEKSKWRVNIVNPGYTATDLNGFSGPQSVEEGVEPMVRLVTGGEEGWKGTGLFVEKAGIVPW